MLAEEVKLGVDPNWWLDLSGTFAGIGNGESHQREEEDEYANCLACNSVPLRMDKLSMGSSLPEASSSSRHMAAVDRVDAS